MARVNIVSWKYVAWKARPTGNYDRDKAKSGDPFAQGVDPRRVYGVKITAQDENGDIHQFWNYSLTRFQSEVEWMTWAIGAMAEHGMELADEPPPDEPDDEFRYPLQPAEEPEDDQPEQVRLRDRVRSIGQRIARWFRA